MPHPNGGFVVRHPDAPGVMVVLDPAVDYDKNDPLVNAYPWAFVPLENAGQIIESVPVEQATRAPGEKRAARRPRKA